MISRFNPIRTLVWIAAVALPVIGLPATAYATAEEPIVDLIWINSTLGATGLGTPSVTTVPGDILTLQVTAYIGHEGLSGYSASHQWTPGVINLNSTGNEYSWVVDLPDGPIDNGVGIAGSQFAGSQFLGPFPMNESITLGELTFEALAGSSSITTFLDIPDGIIDASSQPYQFPIFNTASIDIVPEPSTFALIAIGLLSLCLIARRSSRSTAENAYCQSNRETGVGQR